MTSTANIVLINWALYLKNHHICLYYSFITVKLFFDIHKKWKLEKKILLRNILASESLKVSNLNAIDNLGLTKNKKIKSRYNPKK